MSQHFFTYPTVIELRPAPNEERVEQGGEVNQLPRPLVADRPDPASSRTLGRKSQSAAR